jgi:tRNA (guanosine-2'-O-)-methyltransferase
LGDLDVVEVGRLLEPHVLDERRARLRSVFAARLDAVTVLLDSPHDPHNGAAILRSCDAFGVHRLHVVERVERFLAARSVARGSERWVEAHSHRSVSAAIAALRTSGHELIATHPAGELLPGDLRSLGRIAIVFGNERDGIHPELAEACTRSVRVPMRGFAESLNVSVTAAILLQHATLGRPGDLPQVEQDALYARALVLTIPRASEILAFKGMHLEASAELARLEPPR